MAPTRQFAERPGGAPGSGPEPPCDLAGRGVLVTRAGHQAAGLCRLIAAHGGRPVPLPALEIAGPADPGSLARLLDRLEQYHIVLFVSPNAVARGLEALPRGLPPGLLVGAVGCSTAAALERAGVGVSIRPAQGYDSEALLADPLLQELSGRRVLIFRGDGGRPLLGDTLARRGARVDYAEVYRRRCPRPPVTELLAQWRGQVSLVTATSNQILDNLLEILGSAGREMLLETPLLVISRRMQRHAAARGWRHISVAPGPDDAALLRGICGLLGGRGGA